MNDLIRFALTVGFTAGLACSTLACAIAYMAVRDYIEQAAYDLQAAKLSLKELKKVRDGWWAPAKDPGKRVTTTDTAQMPAVDGAPLPLLTTGGGHRAPRPAPAVTEWPR